MIYTIIEVLTILALGFFYFSLGFFLYEFYLDKKWRKEQDRRKRELKEFE